MHASAAQWIHSEVEVGASQDLQVHHTREITDVGIHVIMEVRGRGTLRLLEREALHALEVMRQQSVCLGLDPSRHVCIRRATVRGIVLESTVLGGGYAKG